MVYSSYKKASTVVTILASPGLFAISFAYVMVGDPIDDA